MARPRLLVATAAAPKPPAEVPRWVSAIDVARRAIGGAAARRSYAADAKDSNALPMPAPRPRNIDAVDATDGGTLRISALHRKNELSWRLRARLGKDTRTKEKFRSSPQFSRPKRQEGAVTVQKNGSQLGRWEARPGYVIAVRVLA